METIEELRAQVAQLREALEDCERELRLNPIRKARSKEWTAAIKRAQAALSTPAPAVPLGRKPREWWVNVYGSQVGYAWESKEKADDFMCKGRIECVHVREVMEDGQ